MIGEGVWVHEPRSLNLVKYRGIVTDFRPAGAIIQNRHSEIWREGVGLYSCERLYLYSLVYQIWC